MVKVECDGCRAPYQIDEKRIPPTGLKMRCPKCGTNLVVMKPGAGPTMAGGLGPPPAASKAPPNPAYAPSPQRPALPTKSGIAPSADDLLDLPTAGRGGGNLGFGEIDMLVDQIEPAGGARSSTAAFGAGAAPKPGGFGDVDLPVAQGVRADLPARAPLRGGRVSTVQFGDIDLPGPPGAPVRRTASFGEIDLPSVSDEGPGLPMGKGGPAGWNDAPGAPRGFGDIDLPLFQGEGGLPLPSHGSGLPTVAMSGLPSTSGGAGLPAMGGAGMPMTATAGMPMTATAGMPSTAIAGMPTFAASGVPTFAAAGMPQAAHYGTPQGLAGFPPPISHSVQAPAVPSLLPSSGDISLDALFNEHAMDMGDDMPRPDPIPSLMSPDGMGDELAMSDGRLRSTAFDDSDRAVPTQSDDPLGDGFDDAGIELAAAPRVIGGDFGHDEVAMDVGGLPRPAETVDRVRPVRKQGNGRKIAIIATVLLTVGGGSLAFEPTLGPFGFYFIYDRVKATDNIASLDALRKDVQADLDEDTAVAAGRALEKAKSARGSMARYRPIAGYTAYVALARGLRFGRRSEDDALAKVLIAGAAGTDEPVDMVTLASATQDAGGPQLAQARTAVTSLIKRLPEDLDATILAAEIELLSRAPDKALPLWKRAVGLSAGNKSARALYGLARAQMASGDAVGAETSARAVIAASANHAGARTLLASIIWQLPDREPEAVTALKKVTEDAAVRSASSDADLVDAYALLGRIHLYRSRISAGDQAFSQALKLDPQSVQALMGHGEVFYRSSRYSEAQSRFEGAIRVDAENVTAKIGLAKTLLALERMKDAKDLMKKLRAAQPKDPVVAFWFGRIEETLGNKKDAESAYTESIKLGGGSVDIVDSYVSLSVLLSGLGRTAEAHDKLLEATKKFPDLAALHRAKGEVAMKMGRYEEAKEEFSGALAKEDDLGTRFKLGIACRQLREFDDAREIFDKIYSFDKDYPSLALERGLLFAETGQTDKALEMYSDALKKAPNDIDLKLRVGATQVIAGHPTEAEAILKEVVKERSTSAEANHFYGRALLAKMINLPEAMRYLDAAVTIDGNRPEYHLYVGWAANELSQGNKALESLNRALELDRTLADAYWQRGVTFRKVNRVVDALENLKIALGMRPNRHEAYATMAGCYGDLQQWPEATEAWKKAIAGNPSVPEWHYRLGKIYAQQGNPGAAPAELEQALTLFDASGRPTPTWLSDLLLLLGDAAKTTQRDKAYAYYTRFLAIVTRGNAYTASVQEWLAANKSAMEQPKDPPKQR